MPEVFTPNLLLPLIQTDQTRKEETHNEALYLLDAVVQAGVMSKSTGTPPDYPADGERWIVGPDAEGAWEDHEDELAVWQLDRWVFFEPKAGWLLFVIDESQVYVWFGTWVNLNQIVNSGDVWPETDIASASETDIGAVQTPRVRITGAVTINSLGPEINRLRIVRFASTPTLVAGASLILPGSISFTAKADDTVIFVSDENAVWRSILWQRAHGYPITTAAEIMTVNSGSVADITSPAQVIQLSMTGGSLTSFGSSAPQGAIKTIICGGFTVTHDNGAIKCPKNVNLTLLTDDVIEIVHEGSGIWRITKVTRDLGIADSDMENIAQATIIGRAAGAGTGVRSPLSESQVKTIIGIPTSTTANTMPKFSDTAGNMVATTLSVDSNNLLSAAGYKSFSVTINDDAVHTFAAISNSATIKIGTGNNQPGATRPYFEYGVKTNGASAGVQLSGVGTVSFAATSLAGTTGADASFNCGNDGSLLYHENRLGANLTFRFTVFQ